MIDWEIFEKKLLELANSEDETESYRNNISLLKILGERSFNIIRETFETYHLEAIEDEFSPGDSSVFEKMYKDALDEYGITVDDWEDEDGDSVFALDDSTILCYKKVYTAFLKKYNIPATWKDDSGFKFGQFYQGKLAEKYPANTPEEWMEKYFPKEFTREVQKDAWYFLASEKIDDGVWESMYETAYSNTMDNCFDDNDFKKLGIDISTIPDDILETPLKFFTIKMIIDQNVPEK